jgi:hypothetical protein
VTCSHFSMERGEGILSSFFGLPQWGRVEKVRSFCLCSDLKCQGMPHLGGVLCSLPTYTAAWSETASTAHSATLLTCCGGKEGGL